MQTRLMEVPEDVVEALLGLPALVRRLERVVAAREGLGAYVSAREAARIAGCRPALVREAARTGALQAHQPATDTGTRWRIARSALDRWIASGMPARPKA